MPSPKEPRRPSWERYFLDIAQLVSRRSSCLRRNVGALLVKDKRILATGYNGVPSGLPHCSEVGCLREILGVAAGTKHELCRGLHAEQNAIIQAAIHGVSIQGAELYSTHHPCVVCAKMLINAHIAKIYLAEDYPDRLAKDLLLQAGIEIAVVPKDRE
jgi:dCMP deaminase